MWDIGFDGVLFDDSGRPFAELHSTFRVDLITDRNNGREIIVQGVVVFAIGGSYPEFPDN